MEICELDDICKQVFKLRGEYDAIKEKLSDKYKELETAELALQAFLDSHSKSKYHVDGVGTFSLQEKYSFKLPSDPEKRDAFFNYLRTKGIFESMVSVNSQTLNAYCRNELEAKLAEGSLDFEIPGIGQPNIYHKVVLRKE